MGPQVAQNNKVSLSQTIARSSALTHKEWQELVAQTAEIREAALLIKQAKELGHDHVAISSSEADIGVIAGYFKGAIYTTDSRVVTMSNALDRIIDTLAELEKDCPLEQSITSKTLAKTVIKIKSDQLKTIGVIINPHTNRPEVAYSNYPATTKALAWCLKTWLKTSSKVGIGNIGTAASSLKNLASHLDDRGRAYVGRIIINSLVENYPLVLANLCKANNDHSFQDLTKPRSA